MQRSAKELCAMLITRALKDLNEDEEEIVVDYLERLKVDVDIDTKPRELCMILLEKLMPSEMKGKVPITAYANQVLGKEKEAAVIKEKQRQEMEKVKAREAVKNRRITNKRNLEAKSKVLPSCVQGPNVFNPNVYKVVVDPELGIVQLADGSSQYMAGVSVSQNLYNRIFDMLDKPIIELINPFGIKAFARIVGMHDEDNDVIYISPFVYNLLEERTDKGVNLRLCNTLPYIQNVKFTFYGTQEELNVALEGLINKLPNTINALSYLSLGMEINENINGKDYKVVVSSIDGYYGDKEDDIFPVFAGLIPPFDNEIPFEIFPDM